MAKRKKNKEEAVAEPELGSEAEPVVADVPVADESAPGAGDLAAAPEVVTEDEPLVAGEADVEGEEAGARAASGSPDEDPEAPPAGPDDIGPVPFDRLESVIESLLFVSNRALSMNDLKRLLRERDSRLIEEAMESLAAKRVGSGVRVVALAGGWHLRSNPENAPWAAKLIAGKPVRLSRAMLETLAIIAYRQPITRPEIDDIRGVDAGPVLRTLLDRELIRVIGKKEDVGRPLLYGTTPEFLRIFSLRDLTELPTLREFHELNAENTAKVEAKHGKAGPAPEAPVEPGASVPGAAPFAPAGAELGRGPDPAEEDALLDELDRATVAASQAAGPMEPQTPVDPPPNPET